MIKRKLLKYTIIYTAEPEGGFTVTVPSLPGCVTFGKDLKEAEKMAKEAIELYLESLKAHKESIPTGGNFFIGSIDLDFPKLMPKVYTPKQVLIKFKKLGFVEDRQRGSHKILYHPKSKNRAVIPFHIKELTKGTFSSILRESKITKEEFEKV